MTFESITNTKLTKRKYKSVGLPKEINKEVEIICAKLECSKVKFLTLAASKLIDEYKNTYEKKG
tara:strand:+ start:816 stop:1007 length:192 start_codon:yes stop_codon:yes gene_type:complete